MNNFHCDFSWSGARFQVSTNEQTGSLSILYAPIGKKLLEIHQVPTETKYLFSIFISNTYTSIKMSKLNMCTHMYTHTDTYIHIQVKFQILPRRYNTNWKFFSQSSDWNQVSFTNSYGITWRQTKVQSKKRKYLRQKKLSRKAI